MSVLILDRPRGGALADMTMAELASWAACLTNVSPGLTYARKQTWTEKEKARIAALRLFSPRAHPGGLSILTMPGLSWGFERMLLLMRESRIRALGDRGRKTKNTYICAIERDEAIYRASLKWMPGAAASLAQLPPTEEKPRALRTYAITRFYRTSFEEHVDAPWRQPQDAAWLDFNGPITSQRMETISRFFRDGVRWRLVLTWMNGRYDSDARSHIENDGYFEWVIKELRAVRPCRVLHQIAYRDTAPMLQLAVEVPQ